MQKPREYTIDGQVYREVGAKTAAFSEDVKDAIKRADGYMLDVEAILENLHSKHLILGDALRFVYDFRSILSAAQNK